MVKIVIGVLIAAVVVIVGFMILDPNVNTNITGSVTEVSETNTTSYKIEGEVNLPGTYALGESATMQELIDAAGGLTANADELAFFSDAVLTANNTYYIASKYDYSDVCNTDEIVKVNINKDDEDTLTTINGISSSIAASIVSYRTGNGVFNTIESLLDVYGIGNATYLKVRNFVKLHE
jgi:competence protein ComEA